MATKTAAVILAGGVLTVGAVLLSRRRASGRSGAAPDAGARWQVVTIGAPASESLAGGALPPPLAELDDLIEARTSAAPGDRGTELAARPRPDAAVDDDTELVRLIRRALRESKQLLEANEIATNEPQPEGHRPATPAGLLVDAITRRSPEEGVL